jgi:hypothetical protein
VNTFERRCEVLKLEGMGVPNSEIVSTLSKKYEVSLQSVRRDIRNRAKWQPTLTDSNPEKDLLRAVNRLEWNYREAAFLFKTTTNENTKLGALSQMRENVKAIAELKGLNLLLARPEAEEIVIRWMETEGKIKSETTKTQNNTA